MNIYVGNLPFRSTAADLERVFGEYGQVDSASVISDRDTGRSRGFGYVEMGDGAEFAVLVLNGSRLRGRPLEVNETRATEATTRPRAGQV